ncbi:transposase [Candidatus Enterovibrio escicola]|uniref:transposase n=1 Tax=Candidatus Enterovibrio escicola TaxID=1927127 RepID=UPI001313E87A|nr:transposase [Candidatus Enterovibrio escacola]
MPYRTDNLWRSLYGDKGYISSSLEKTVDDKGISLMTNTRKNIEPKVMKLWDCIILRKQFVIETVFYQLKNISQIEYSRH